MKLRKMIGLCLTILMTILIGALPVMAAPLYPVLFERVNYCNKPAVNPGEPSFSEMFPEQGVWGFGCQFAAGNILADQFTLASASRLTSVELFAYQSGSSTTSSFNGAHVTIYNGNPMSGGTIIWGDMSTNIFSSTEFTGCYRVSYGTISFDRPIMKIVAQINVELPAGTYWIAYSLDGSLASGPWGVPSILDSAFTNGTGIQYVTSEGGWRAPVDNSQPSFPFLIRGIAKVSQAAPAAPAAASVTDTAITLETVTGAEYKRDDGAWQASPEFTGLSPYTEYTFYCRLSETETLLASPGSAGTMIRTDKSSVPAPAAPVVAGKTDVSITLETVTGAEYRCDGGSWQANPAFTGLSPNSEYSFDIRMAETTTAHASPASLATTARTQKSTITAVPPAPAAASISADAVTLQTVDGAEYRVNDGAWQSSSVFAGLLPNTTYAFTLRLAETEIALASPASEILYSITLRSDLLDDLPQTGEENSALPLFLVMTGLMAMIVLRLRLSRKDT